MSRVYICDEKHSKPEIVLAYRFVAFGRCIIVEKFVVLLRDQIRVRIFGFLNVTLSE